MGDPNDQDGRIELEGKCSVRCFVLKLGDPFLVGNTRARFRHYTAWWAAEGETWEEHSTGAVCSRWESQRDSTSSASWRDDQKRRC